MNVPFVQNATFAGLISTKDYKTSQEWAATHTTVQSNSSIWNSGGSNSQILLFNEASALLTISNGNTISLSSLSGGGGQTLFWDSSAYKLSISGGNTILLSSISIQTMIGATDSTDGQEGVVPKPFIEDRLKFLRGDGTWQNIQTSNKNYIYRTTDTNLSLNEKYAFNTLLSPITALLPDTPDLGDVIEIFDIAGSWNYNNLVIVSNSAFIEHETENLECDVNNGLVKLIFCGDVIGWRIIPLPKHDTLITFLPPSVTIGASVTVGSPPFTVIFAGTNNLPSSIAPVNNWYWNLTGGSQPDYFTQNVTFTYNTTGVYTATLTAVNDFGTTIATTTITSQSAPNVPQTGLVARFIADYGVTESNGTISSWTDQESGIVATAFNNPVLLTNQLNGRNAISFNGIDQYFTFSLLSPLQSGTQRTFVIIGKYNNPGATPQQGYLNSQEQDLCYVFKNANENRSYFYTNFAQIRGPQKSLANYHITIVNHEGAIGRNFIRINGQTSIQIDYGAMNVLPQISNFVIGGRELSISGITEPLFGEIVEILIYNRTLTISDIVALENYANITIP